MQNDSRGFQTAVGVHFGLFIQHHHSDQQQRGAPVWWVVTLCGNCFLICGHHPIETKTQSCRIDTSTGPWAFSSCTLRDWWRHLGWGLILLSLSRSPVTSDFLYVVPSWWFASLSSDIVRGTATAASVEMFKMKEGSVSKPLCPPDLCGSLHSRR